MKKKKREVKPEELERIKQIIRTLQPAAEIIECKILNAKGEIDDSLVGRCLVDAIQRAADATVLKRNEAFVFLAHDAALLNEVRVNAVSYTHLDVYKRQTTSSTLSKSGVSPGQGASAIVMIEPSMKDSI